MQRLRIARRDTPVTGTGIAARIITPMTVRPSISNRREVQRAFEREYPAILRVAGVATFIPALNLDKVVPVWIKIPITFQVR